MKERSGDRSISLDRHFYRKGHRDESRDRRIGFNRKNRSYSRDFRRRPEKNSRKRSEDSRDSRYQPSKRKRSAERRDSRSRSRSRSRSGSSSIDDEVGHFHARKGDLVTSRYEIREEMGKGTFGKVFKCKDLKHNDTVALKMVRSIKRYIKSAQIEADILADVFKKQKEHATSYCVKMFSHFKFNEHYVMVFEPLGMSVYDVIRKNEYAGLPLPYVQSVAKQIFSALAFLQSIQLIHTDLKLENILFVHTTMHSVESYHRGHRKTLSLPANPRIKLIDFGGATYADDEEKSRVINTRQYRSPEVLLELEWSYPSDIWSAACMIAEIYDGDLLFQTHEELEHLALIEKVCGHFPPPMVTKSQYKDQYFNNRGRVRVEDLTRDSAKFVQKMLYLDQFFTPHNPNVPSDSSVVELQDLMKKILAIDPSIRLTAQQAVDHAVFKDVV